MKYFVLHFIYDGDEYHCMAEVNTNEDRLPKLDALYILNHACKDKQVDPPGRFELEQSSGTELTFKSIYTGPRWSMDAVTKTVTKLGQRA